MRKLDETGSLDFHRANLPNCAAELGYRLGVDSTPHEMMREFFEAMCDSGTRRSFRISSRLVMEGGHIELTEATDAEVKPVPSPKFAAVHIYRLRKLKKH